MFAGVALWRNVPQWQQLPSFQSNNVIRERRRALWAQGGGVRIFRAPPRAACSDLSPRVYSNIQIRE